METTKPSCSFAISSDGTATELTDIPAFDVAPEAAYVWTHFHVRQQGAREWLEEEAKLDPTVVTAMLAEDTCPRAVIKDDGVMVIFRGMNLHEGESPEEMLSLRMWIDERRVITTRMRDIKAIEEIQESVAKGKSPTSPADFLKSITSRMFARMEPVLIDLEDSIAAAEEQIASNSNSDLCDGLLTMRKRVAIFRRYITPQKATASQSSLAFASTIRVSYSKVRCLRHFWPWSYKVALSSASSILCPRVCASSVASERYARFATQRTFDSESSLEQRCLGRQRSDRGCGGESLLPARYFESRVFS